MAEWIDPVLLKHLSGLVILSLASIMTWYGKLSDSILGTLLLGAAAAVGFQITAG